MHEFAIAASLRDLALECAAAYGGGRITRIVCSAGAMRQIVPSCLRMAFEACSVATAADGAELVVESEPVEVTCRSCGSVEQVNEVCYLCPRCESPQIRVTGGRDLTLLSVSMERKDHNGHSGSQASAGAQRQYCQ